MVAILHTLCGEDKVTKLIDHVFIREVIMFNDQDSAKRFLKFTMACVNDVEDIDCFYDRDRTNKELSFRCMFTIPNRNTDKDLIYIDEYTPIDVRNGFANSDTTELFASHFKRYKYGLVKCLLGKTGLSMLSLEPSLEVLRAMKLSDIEEHTNHARKFVSEWEGGENNG